MVDLHSVISEQQRWTLSAESPTPLYHRLYSLLKSFILDGTLAVGMRLPSEQELAREFDVSRITTKRALDELAHERLVERRRGKGTWVTYRHQPEPLHAPMIGLLQEIASLGKETLAVVLDCKMMHPPLEVRQALGLNTGDTALYLARVRHHEGRRIGYYRSWTIGLSQLPDLSVFERTPRITYYRALGLRTKHMRQVISATSATDDAASALGVTPGTPLLSLVRLIYADRDAGSHAVDYLKVLYNPEQFEYHINLDLEDPA